MFSGITNQFTSLVGAVKGQADEDVPAPSQDAAAANVNAAAVAAVDATSADAGAGGELAGEAGDEAAKRKPSLVDSFVTEATGWLGSAKGWLGNASIPSMPNMPSMPSMPAMPSMPSIPGMRKTAGEGEPGAEGADALTAAGGAVIGEEDDKSSATEGADSHPASGGGTPTGEDGQIGQGKGESVKITTKVTQQAKHFGSFLSSAISKAGTKIKETTHIPQTLLESFNKDQEAFAKGQGSADSGVAPWIGHPNEVKIKEEIMGLSQDRRNFVRAPPAGVDFEFNYESSYPTALAIMAEDKALETMRFELVPKIITEENFWRNYFYRVSLIIQAAELGTLGADGVGQASSGEDVKENQVESQDKVSKDSQNLQDMNLHEKTDDSKQKQASNVEVIDTAPKSVGKLSESEFVSDKYQTTADTELDEIKDGLRRLGIDSMTKQVLNDNDEEQWEKDLEAELKDYEVVSSSSTTNIRSKKKKNNSKKKTSINGSSNSSVVGSGGVDQEVENEDEMPTISNLRTRNNNDWEEEYADLIEDTDDLK